jgi:hypothetical protein
MTVLLKTFASQSIEYATAQTLAECLCIAWLEDKYPLDYMHGHAFEKHPDYKTANYALQLRVQGLTTQYIDLEYRTLLRDTYQKWKRKCQGTPVVIPEITSEQRECMQSCHVLRYVAQDVLYLASLTHYYRQKEESADSEHGKIFYSSFAQYYGRILELYVSEHQPERTQELCRHTIYMYWMEASGEIRLYYSTDEMDPIRHSSTMQ